MEYGELALIVGMISHPSATILDCNSFSTVFILFTKVRYQGFVCFEFSQGLGLGG